MGALQDFLAADREPVDNMTAEEMAVELQGWRAFIGMVPPEVVEWVIRLGEPFRFITRKYEPKTGVLTAVKFEPVEFQLELLEPSFDPVRGNRLIEQKILTLGEDAVLYFEDVLWKQDFEDWQSENDLAQESLDL